MIALLALALAAALLVAIELLPLGDSSYSQGVL